VILRISAAQLATTPLDWKGNLDACLQVLGAARDAGTQILVLPELCLTGYGCEDAFLAPWVADRAWASLARLAAEVPDGMLVAVGHSREAARPSAQRRGHHHPRAHRRRGLQAPPSPAKASTTSPAGSPRGRRGNSSSRAPWDAPWATRSSIGAGSGSGSRSARTPGRRIVPGLDLAAADCDVILSPSASHFALGKDEGPRTPGAGRLAFAGGSPTPTPTWSATNPGA
jgi:NAD+ synthase (glutamine-hydrolysing)